MLMRFACFLFCLLLAVTPLKGQPDDVDQKDPYEWSARVDQAAGIGWYVMAEPLREYKVLKVVPLDVTNDYIETVHLKQLYNVLKYRGIKLKRKYPKADALVTTNGQRLQLIRYTDDTKRHSRIGNVQTINDTEVYLWSEPLKVHEPAFQMSFSEPFEARRKYLQKGLASIVEKARNLANEKGQPFDALVFGKDRIQAIEYYEPSESSGK